MTKSELEKYYRALETMFRSKGWKSFLEDVLKNANDLNILETCKDQKDLYYRKGQLAMAASILNYQALIEQSKSDNLDESDI